MMALFIVLWIVANNVTVRASVADYFRDPGAMSKTSSGVMNGANSMKPFSDAQPTQPLVPHTTAAPAHRNGVPAPAGRGGKAPGWKAMGSMQMIAAIPDLKKFKDQVVIKITEDGLRIELIEQSEGLFFDIGSARLKPDAMQLLRLIASRIGTFPNDVVIEGHTDNRPYTRSGYTQLGPQHRPRQLRAPGDRGLQLPRAADHQHQRVCRPRPEKPGQAAGLFQPTRQRSW